MKTPVTLRLICILAFLASLAIPGLSRDRQRELILTDQREMPVLTVKSPGAEGIQIGFEGGCVIKLKGVYHLFTSEMMEKPIGVKMKLGHWMSTDRMHWKRISTLYESSGDYTGKDPRAALWAPMPVYDELHRRWNPFYVAYRCAPSTPERWLEGHEGKIWRAKSRVEGIDGIGGPYDDIGIILQPGVESQPWEGLQGTDSFFPYKVESKWYGFYGSADTQWIPVKAWKVGLASASRLAGPWGRLPEGNPVLIEKVFIENPVVTRLADGAFAAVYDCLVPNAIGYAFSSDGVHWEPGRALIVQPQGKGHWAYDIRTPLGLVPEGNDTFTLFYTGLRSVPPPAVSPDAPLDYAVGLATVKLVYTKPDKP